MLMLFDFASIAISLPACTRGFTPHRHLRSRKTDMMIALAC